MVLLPCLARGGTIRSARDGCRGLKIGCWPGFVANRSVDGFQPAGVESTWRRGRPI